MEIKGFILNACFLRDGQYLKVVDVALNGTLLIQSISVPLGCNRLVDIKVESYTHYKTIESVKGNGFRQIPLEQFEREVKKSVESVVDALFCLN